jgi:hypothetical protein
MDLDQILTPALVALIVPLVILWLSRAGARATVEPGELRG